MIALDVRTPWMVLVLFVVGCTQPTPAPEAAGSEQLVAAAEKIEAAATKLETAASSLEQSVRALEAMRAEEAERSEHRARPAPLPDTDDEVAPTTSPIPGAGESIACPSEGKCTIRRSFVESLAGNPSLFVRQMRIVPSLKDGKSEGMRLYGIRRGSLPALLGFQNGDTIVRVADQDLASAEDAMALYGKLRGFDRLTIDFIRRGEPLLLEVAVVDE